MINIVIFSLFMCTVSTDASDWFTSKAAQRDYNLLESNLKRSDITPQNSVMLQVCKKLSQPQHFQNEDVVLQIDIDMILYTLSQASANADKLAKTFCDEDKKVKSRRDLILHALGRCVSNVNHEVLKKILLCAPAERYKNVGKIMGRYKCKESKRFSKALKSVVWEMQCVHDQGLQLDAETAVMDPWFKGESVQKHYETLIFNLAQYVNVSKSPMLQVCEELSRPDFFQKGDDWLKIDIETVLHILSEESASNAFALAQNFCKEGVSREGLLHDFGLCVPQVRDESIKQHLRCCLPKKMSRRSYSIHQTFRSYQHQIGFARFSPELQSVLQKWDQTSKFKNQHLMNDVAVTQSSPSRNSDVIPPESLPPELKPDIDDAADELTGNAAQTQLNGASVTQCPPSSKSAVIPPKSLSPELEPDTGDAAEWAGEAKIYWNAAYADLIKQCPSSRQSEVMLPQFVYPESEPDTKVVDSCEEDEDPCSEIYDSSSRNSAVISSDSRYQKSEYDTDVPESPFELTGESVQEQYAISETNHADQYSRHGDFVQHRLPSMSGYVLDPLVVGSDAEVEALCFERSEPLQYQYSPQYGAYGPAYGVYGPAYGVYGPAYGVYGPAYGVYGPAYGAYGPAYGLYSSMQ